MGVTADGNTVAKHVPRNTAITVRETMTVRRSNASSLFDTEEDDQDDSEAVESATSYVDGDPFVIGRDHGCRNKRPEGILAFRDGDLLKYITGDKRILDYVEPETEYALQPVTGRVGVFGGA